MKGLTGDRKRIELEAEVNVWAWICCETTMFYTCTCKQLKHINPKPFQARTLYDSTPKQHQRTFPTPKSQMDLNCTHTTLLPCYNCFISCSFWGDPFVRLPSFYAQEAMSEIQSFRSRWESLEARDVEVFES